MAFTLLEVSIIAGAVKTFGAVTQTVGDVLKEIYKINPFYKHIAGATSLTDVAKDARVEPITIVSSDLLNEPFMDGVMQTLLNIFTAYYLQAVSLNMSIGHVKVGKILKTFNPDPHSFLSLESYNSGLLDRQAYKFALPCVALEATKEEIERAQSWAAAKKIVEVNYPKVAEGSEEWLYLVREIQRGHKPNLPKKEIVGKAKINDSIEKAASLAVGKIIDVSVASKDGDKTMEAVIPVIVRLATSVMSTRPMIDLLVGNGIDKDFISRWNKWRDGQIEFIRDLILCQDIIDEQKKIMMNPDNEAFRNILTRINKARSKYLFSGTNDINLAMASNLYVMSEAVANEVEFKLGAPLSSAKARRKIFTNNYAMIIAVIDREWDQATLYYRGNDVATQVSLKNMASKDNKSTDIMDIFKAFTMGNSPVL